MSSLPIASAPTALTPAWLTDALRAGGTVDPSVMVESVDATPVGTGQMCDSLRLRLTYSRGPASRSPASRGPAAKGPASTGPAAQGFVTDGAEGPASIVAKLPAADPTSRATAKSLRNYELEVRFYQQLAADLPVRTPRCLYADIDVEEADFILLLEDLAPARQGDQLAGCTPDQAAVAVAELPKLHAPRWGDPSLASIEWLHRDPATSQAFMAQLLPALHEGFRERYADRLDVEVADACDALFARLGAHLGGRQAPATIVHGDYRLDNLLFGDPGGGVPVAVVDWQTVATGSALGDVAYFLGAGLLPEDRRAHEEALVRDYLGRLHAAGVEGYGWDACWEDYRRGTWGGLIMAVAASMLVERTDRGDEMFLTMARRHARHALDLDAAALLGT